MARAGSPANSVTQPLTVALAAGEASGDTLGAGLIEALKTRVPDARFVGIAGPKMIAAGCEPWYRAEELSVMGLAEVLPHLPRLLKIRRQLRERIKALPADVFVGIDAPDFNLPAARWLKSAGIPTVLYGAGPHSLLDANGHRADEKLVLEDLRKATQVIALSLADLLSA